MYPYKDAQNNIIGWTNWPNDQGHANIDENDPGYLAYKGLDVNGYKNKCIKANQLEVGRLIAVLFGELDPEKLKLKQLNALANALVLLEKKIDGTAVQSDLDVLAVLKQLNTSKDAIRSAENDAAALINDPLNDTIAKVDAVKTPLWPG